MLGDQMHMLKHDAKFQWVCDRVLSLVVIAEEAQGGRRRGRRAGGDACRAQVRLVCFRPNGGSKLY